MMKFFKMDKSGQTAVAIAFVLSIISIIIVIYFFQLAKNEWYYNVDIDNCQRKTAVIEKIYKGENKKDGKVLGYLEMDNGDQICFFRKNDGFFEYPGINKKILNSLNKGKEITYIYDKKTQIDRYCLAYNLEIDGKIYFSLEEIKRCDKLESILNLLVCIVFAILSFGMIYVTIFFYKIADTKDIYIK